MKINFFLFVFFCLFLMCQTTDGVAQTLDVDKLNSYAVIAPSEGDMHVDKLNSYAVIVPSGGDVHVDKINSYAVIAPSAGYMHIDKINAYAVIITKMPTIMIMGE